MPKENIERAIQRGAGSGDGEAYEAITYEGYGPGGVAIICQILTDNRNRTAADVRHIFTKNGGSLGTPGSVAWQFDRKGVIMLDAAAVDEDAVMEAALEAGAEDISEDGSQWQVTTDPADFAAVRQALEDTGVPYLSAELTLLPKTTVAPDEKEARQVLRLMDLLEDNDDVQGVYANFDISEEVLEAVAG
jgi:YebC/PmpR family DNA-binding regulatory protein